MRAEDVAPGAALGGIAGMSAVILASLLLALGAPLETTALALIVLGVVHNVFELRYLGGRYAHAATGAVLPLLVLLVSGIMLARAAGFLIGGGWSLRLEVMLTYAVLGVAGCVLVRGHAGWRALVIGLAMVACAVSLSWPGYYFVVMTHLHNVVPLAFLWELSAVLAPRVRGWFRAVQVAWVVVVPLAILLGAFDGLLGQAAPTVFDAAPDVIAAGVMPGGAAGSVMGLRFLTAFAFMQLVHFVVWIWYFPRYTPGVTRAFEQMVPALRGWRPWALAGAVGGGLALLFLADYGQGRTVYSVLASYHAYLELAAVLVMLPVLTSRMSSRDQALRP